MLTSQLHASLEDPVLDSINFLNEIMDRYPNAISFAPGAPNPAHLRDLDITRYINNYIKYLCDSRALTREKAQSILYQYGPPRGLINDLIAAAIKRDKNIQVDPDSIVITVGAQEAMVIVLRTLFRSASDRLAVISPCFAGILGAARLLDIAVVEIEETDQHLDLNRLEKELSSARRNNQAIRALYIAPDYSNPAGTLLTLAERRRLLELAEQYDLFLLEDNVYGFTAAPGEEIPSLKALDVTGRVIFLGTFAKICLPGARVGYVVADQLVQNSKGVSHRLADDLATIKSMISMNTSPICQAVIGGMLLEKGGSIAAFERERSQLYRNNLALLLNALSNQLAALNGITWNRPTGGFFVRMRLPVTVDMSLLELSAANYGVLWTPMSLFYLNQGSKNELRLACSYLTPERIEEGVDRLVAFLQSI